MNLDLDLEVGRWVNMNVFFWASQKEETGCIMSHGCHAENHKLGGLEQQIGLLAVLGARSLPLRPAEPHLFETGRIPLASCQPVVVALESWVFLALQLLPFNMWLWGHMAFSLCVLLFSGHQSFGIETYPSAFIVPSIHLLRLCFQTRSGHIYKYGELGPEHVFLGDTVQPIMLGRKNSRGP